MKKFQSLLVVNILLCLLSQMISYPVYARSANDNSLYGKDFNKQLFIINNTTDKNQALDKLQQLLAVNGLSKAQQFSALLAQGKLLFSLTRYQEAVKVLKQAKTTIAPLNELSLLAKANKFLGVIYYYQGELDQALTAYQQALDYYDQAGQSTHPDAPIKRANLLNNIALVYISMADYTQALHHYQLAEALYQNYGSDADKVDVRFNIALLHVNLKRFDIAIAMLTEVIAKFEQLNDKLSIAKAMAGLGIAYKHSGQYVLAQEHILKGLNYFQRHGYQHDTASQLHNLSAIYTYLGHYDQALSYAKEAVLLSKNIGHQKAHAGALQILAKVYLFQGELALAQQSINLSSTIATKINYKSILVDNLAISALISSALREPSKALTDFHLYERYQHEAANVMLNEQLAKFESEQLAQQLIQLRQKNKLEELQTAKTEQRRTFLLLAVVLILLLSFFVYRRYLESRITKVLEQRVKQRTHELELTSQKLRQANTVKSQFLANMSHEIRTPLTAIVGHAEAIIHQDVNQQDLAKEVDVIHGNSLHLLALINDILDLSKIEAEKFQLELRPQNLADVIQELADMFTEEALRKGLVFTIEHQLSFPFMVNVDGRRLRQILINLCSNAIKFTPKGRVTLSIKWSQEQLSFTVSDTGIGLKPAQIQQIFEIFTQADSSISRRFGGSGLGLSLSNQLAQLMGGTITVQSELGKGSHFSFVFPCSIISAKELSESSTQYEPLPNKEPDLAQVTGKVLLAEDHDDNRRLITRLLEGLGLQVLCARNGIEALQLCKEHRPPLILLDIQMPEMDGITAFMQLRELGFSQPIYALTANAMSHEISQYLALGFTGHLAKPIERVSFINTIAQHYKDITPAKSETAIENIKLSDLIKDFKLSLTDEKKSLTRYLETHNQASLARTVHRISGAAQMFGFTELSQAAKELDRYLKSIKRNSGVPTAEESEQQSHCIDDLTHCLIDEITLAQSNK